ncbi:hypothetical protein CHLRE_07g328150v5 [Chlamydomonas reinhardtii]|uniref:protein disulfide-isomerase n=1 Tax=Chlamydomonas reinhardtii TaxID=3055 RepID=A8IHI1_CHLRE|nr:uncharacterized protein CHLRE_07g328150v5 [Chlamydomonas reinhardtii]XP_042922703.1 uncharacterized protein CHLRE_07g328150v5 [Chlamydomonas reinhardtii]PNW80746.1 hypothetical protein CHLRE_07g328150v5 [Chlamydomonas reinhardtii]PNW80747.1 hypothetical protein CHLRE_07g328150v5 [Chlamydomonas reinhardtii]|eukprot:XP_001690462.1 protein disulfide isomerase [Chlamydomonas reinhardtii]
MSRARTLAAAALLVATILVSPAAAFYSSKGPVVELTSSNLKDKVKGAGVMLVEFYAPWCGHCKALKPAWEQAAKALRGIVAVGAADCDTHKEVAGEYRVQGFPTIKLLYVDDASGSIKTVDYNGGRTAKELVTFALDKAKSLALKRLGEKADSGSSRGSGAGNGGGSDNGFYQGTDVIVLTEDNFKSQVVKSDELWLVEMYAPWCGHCKALKPAWIEAAGELAGKVRLGAVDCTVHQSVCQEYGVQGYPTIKFFGQNKRSPEDYNGGRDSGSIVAWGNSKFAAMVPPPEPVELTSADVFGKECVGDASGAKPKRMCIIAFLPNLLDSKAAGRNRYIKTLKGLAEAYKDKPYSYLWVEGAQQPALEANFDVGGFGYPAVVAFNPSEKKYTVCKSAFELSHVKDWMETMRMGGTGAVPLHGSLATPSRLTPWDGQDAQEEAVDEFSLDDILNEEL